MREGCESMPDIRIRRKSRPLGGGDRSDKKIVSKTLPLAEYLEAEEARIPWGASRS